MSSGVIGASPTRPRMPSVPKYLRFANVYPPSWLRDTQRIIESPGPRADAPPAELLPGQGRVPSWRFTAKPNLLSVSTGRSFGLVPGEKFSDARISPTHDRLRRNYTVTDERAWRNDTRLMETSSAISLPSQCQLRTAPGFDTIARRWYRSTRRLSCGFKRNQASSEIAPWTRRVVQ